MGGQSFLGIGYQQLTVVTGYLAIMFLALTLLIGPVNLLLGKRNPASSYLRRDVGIWTAVFSIFHVFFGLQLHGRLTFTGDRGILSYIIAPDGSLYTNSFGLANWTGLAATVIVVGLLVTSNDLSLRKLKPKRWKQLQRMNYALFVLVIAHAYFYGALLRLESPFTILLILIVIAVAIGQVVGIRLWRRRNSSRRQRNSPMVAAP